MYKVNRRESSITLINLEKALGAKGFIWERGDSSGYNVYIKRCNKTGLVKAIRVYSNIDRAELRENGVLRAVVTKREMLARLSRDLRIEQPSVPTDPPELRALVIDRGFIPRGDNEFQYPNSLLSFRYDSKHNEVEISYNTEEVGTTTIEEFRAKLDSILAYYRNL